MVYHERPFLKTNIVTKEKSKTNWLLDDENPHNNFVIEDYYIYPNVKKNKYFLWVIYFLVYEGQGLNNFNYVILNRLGGSFYKQN